VLYLPIENKDLDAIYLHQVFIFVKSNYDLAKIKGAENTGRDIY